MLQRIIAIALSSIGLCVAGAGCSDDGASCGPGNAPASGLTLTVGGETVTYGGFTASVNNDCTIQGAGVISVSVHGTQDGAQQALTLCLPRPDLIEAAPQPLVGGHNPPDAGDRVHVVDVSASLSGGCTVMRDASAAVSGTASFAGYCSGGADHAGYALGLSGQVPLRRTCGATVDSVTGTLGGEVAVAVP